MGQRKSAAARGSGREAISSATHFEDLVIVARRNDARTVGVRVEASPAGRMTKPVKVAFSADEGAKLRSSFMASQTRHGQMEIQPEQASGMGRRLAQVLFPGPVFRLLAEGLRSAIARPKRGLRIRLDMDASLVDLPWEYVHRPDRAGRGGVSDFLLLDPTISLVRQAADDRIGIQPITGRRRLAFVGTFWEKNEDRWEVRKEYELLRRGLAPVRSYIEPRFALASDAAAFESEGLGEAGIFHYSGHCDFDDRGRAYLLREVPTSRDLARADTLYVDALAPRLARGGARLAVMNASNSGFWPAVKPLLGAGLPAVLGLNGPVASQSTIEFCARLYESLAVGLTLDEAVGRARLHVMKWGRHLKLFDWGLYMVYMPSPEATLFPRAATRAVATRQEEVRQDHAATIGGAMHLARDLDGHNFGEIMSELAKHRVLILGRFTDRRLKVLEAIKARLQKHRNHYEPELFTFDRPEARNLIEAIAGFAAMSRFIVADLSEPKSVQAELQAIVPHFPSVPVVPLINRTGREYATFSALQCQNNVVKPTVRYRDLDDLMEKLDDQVVPLAEQTLAKVRPAKSA